jgi:hypothetical protein
MDTTIKHQQQLLDQARQIYHRTPISAAYMVSSEATEPAGTCLFDGYRERARKGWREVRQENLKSTWQRCMRTGR